MSRRSESTPQRWREGGARDPLSLRAAELLDVAPPPPLGPVRREQIARRLSTSVAHAHAGLPFLAKAAGVVAIAAGVAVGVVRSASSPRVTPSATAVVPTTAPSPQAPPLPSPAAARTESALAPATRAPSSGPSTARGVTKIAARMPSAPAKAAPASSGPPPNDSVSPGSPPPLVRSSPTLSPTAPRPPTEHSAPERESAPYPAPTVTYEAPEPPALPVRRSEPRLLADALASLHADGDAKAALALLAEHRRRFPNGALRAEARVAEVEALLSLDRRSDALRVLDGLALERLSRGRDLGVLRGELRAQAGRCAEAVADFDRCANAPGCDVPTEERALFGRASCRAKLGQTTAARSDLEHYLVRFPRGWRSEAVRRALAEEKSVRP